MDLNTSFLDDVEENIEGEGANYSDEEPFLKKSKIEHPVWAYFTVSKLYSLLFMYD